MQCLRDHEQPTNIDPLNITPQRSRESDPQALLHPQQSTELAFRRFSMMMRQSQKRASVKTPNLQSFLVHRNSDLRRQVTQERQGLQQALEIEVRSGDLDRIAEIRVYVPDALGHAVVLEQDQSVDQRSRWQVVGLVDSSKETGLMAQPSSIQENNFLAIEQQIIMEEPADEAVSDAGSVRSPSKNTRGLK